MMKHPLEVVENDALSDVEVLEADLSKTGPLEGNGKAQRQEQASGLQSFGNDGEIGQNQGGKLIELQLEERGSKLGARIKSLQEDDCGAPFRVTVTSVTEDGRAAKAGLLQGNRLILVDDMPVEAFADYEELYEAIVARRPLRLTFVQKPQSESFMIVNKKSKQKLTEEKHLRVLRTKDKHRIHSFAFKGVADTFRPLFWRILLGYLPADSSDWSSVVEKQRNLYETYKKEFLENTEYVRPKRLQGQGWWETDDNDWKAKPNKDLKPVSTEEMLQRTNGLAEAENEDKDSELRETIWKDVQRTHPGFHFFADARCEVLERILFIYAKLNPGLEYVQGMNEIVAPILFVFGSLSSPPLLDSDLDYAWEENYEPDTFFCFCSLMGELRDLYMQGMDSDSEGIQGQGERLMYKLMQIDPAVAKHIRALEINPQFFALRWLTTLLSRELELPDTVRLWDCLFADEQRFDFLFDVCCAMIVLQRKQILNGDFSDVIQILQKYPQTDIGEIIHTAIEIRTHGGSKLVGSDSLISSLTKGLRAAVDFTR